ncbi:glycosyltransferase family 2 protein [Polynucleobacter paneuropaeus]|uniref:Glycosyltransferase n=1 Tax=Polynucleobacter paneuropaeus TaxID=2527775 RepID=A0A2Z4JQU4_9BURK|nr:glycosyltransferase family 2 protein [Polynucleobacter paneuropaeus]AWW49188.1 glycosyltransferase [Polynucleobacter paneuropaeus]
MLLSIVIPVFNNSKTLEKIFDQILTVWEKSFGDLQIEVIFVNDGSSDDSRKVIERLQRSNKIVQLVNLSRNFGQLGALMAGFKNAKGDAIICISADLQDPVELMGKMVNHWLNGGAEIVICHRQGRLDGLSASLASKVAYKISRLTYTELPLGGFDYWLMTKRINNMLLEFKGRHNFLQGYLVSLGFSKTFIPYVRRQREVGKSGYSLSKKIKIVYDFIVDTSHLPIQLISLVGFIFSAISIIYTFFIFYAWYCGETPFKGWAPIMIAILLTGGLIMMMLGIIGEYIWRIYDNQRDFPAYIID